MKDRLSYPITSATNSGTSPLPNLKGHKLPRSLYVMFEKAFAAQMRRRLLTKSQEEFSSRSSGVTKYKLQRRRK
jgi:hypothetical protein